MSHEITCKWTEDLSFEALVNGHTLVLDADPSHGGKDRGPRPKILLLTALAGCTGMDVVSILNKMKQPVTFFNMRITGDLTEEEPTYYSSIKIFYQFKKSDNLDDQKIKKAVDLSQERYCGVSAQLKALSDLSYEIEYMD